MSYVLSIGSILRNVACVTGSLGTSSIAISRSNATTPAAMGVATEVPVMRRIAAGLVGSGWIKVVGLSISTRSVNSDHSGSRFISSIGPGANLELNRTKGDSLLYKIPRLSTRIISPTLADIRTIFTEQQVQDAIRNSRFTTNLYLIVSVQIAHSTEYLSSRGRENGSGAHLSVDLAAAGVPLSLEASVEATKSRDDKAGGKIVNDFMFAYSLREVLYRRKNVTEQRQPKLAGDFMENRSGWRPYVKEAVEQKFKAEFAGLKDAEEELTQY